MNLLKAGSLSLLLSATLLFGCAAETEPDFDGGAVTNTKPTIGTTYTFHHLATNNGSTTEDDTVVYTTTISPLDIKGKSNAYIFVNSTSQQDSRTIAYETGGNISVLVPLVTQSTQDVQWMTIPLTGSGGSKNLLLSEFETDASGVTTTFKLTASTSLVGTETFNVGTTSYTAKKIKVTSTLTATTLGIPVSKNDDDFFWWIPDLGFYGKSEEGGLDDPTGQIATDVTTETLLSVKKL